MKYKFLCISLLFLSCSDDDGNAPLNTPNDAVVNIISVSEITENSAIVSAEVVSSSENVTERGIVWSASGTPTVDDNTISSGSGLGEFQVTIQGLDPESSFQIRAYARTASGVQYSGSNSFETTNFCDGAIYNGDIEISTQEELETFALGNWCEIRGKLTIRYSVSDLSPLINLKKVRSLTLLTIYSLENLNGLNNLETIEGSLIIQSNQQMNSLEGLNSLTSVPGKLMIKGNPSLKNIDALSNVTSNVQEIEIELNALENLNGLIGIKNVVPLDPINNENGSSITIDEYQIRNINGLSNLEKVEGSFSLRGTFNNIDALSNLKTVKGTIRLIAPELENVNGLSNFTEIPPNIIISGPSLTNINGFSGYNSFDNLELFDLESLTSLSGLSNLISVKLLRITGLRLVENFEELSSLKFCEQLYIVENESINNLSGLSNLVINSNTIIVINSNSNLNDISDLTFGEEIYSLGISNNLMLTSLNGVENISRINQTLGIESNKSLLSLDYFDSLTHCSWFRIVNNPGLSDLRGFENLINVDKFQVSLNSNLIDFCGTQNLFDNDSMINNYDVEFNAYNPTLQDMLDGNCSQ